MRVLISGAGIAGLSLAYCLSHLGHEVIVVERDPRLRDDGYMIDFFGPGYGVAGRMGLLADLEKIHYPVNHLVFQRRDGQEKFSLPYAVLRRRLFDGRHFNFMRGELERVLCERLERGVDLRWGTTVEEISQDRDSVRAALTDGTVTTADLLVGADGVHSRVRELSFGGEGQFIRYLGYNTAAFIVDDPDLAREAGGSFHTLTLLGRQVALYPIRGDRVASFFVHKSATPPADSTPRAAREELRAVYAGVGWIVPRLLEHLASTKSVYFDAVSQVVMPSWSIGRVVLAGDACGCVSLLAGQGASLAIAGGYVLASEVSSADLEVALSRYEQRMRPGVESLQRVGRDVGRWFVPEKQSTIELRDLAMRLSAWPLISRVVRGRLASEDFLARQRRR